MFVKSFKPAAKLSSSLTIAAAVLAYPAVAHAGFFDQLFGMPSPAPQVEAPTYSEPSYEGAAPWSAPARRHHVHRRLAETVPNKQKTTDLMHDATLRPGDAVMMKDGMHVFQGGPSAHHDKDEFVALDDADDVGRHEKAELVAMDNSRNDPTTRAHDLDTVTTGRSAAISSPIVRGYKITDAAGKSVRYVGP